MGGGAERVRYLVDGELSEGLLLDTLTYSLERASFLGLVWAMGEYPALPDEASAALMRTLSSWSYERPGQVLVWLLGSKSPSGRSGSPRVWSRLCPWSHLDLPTGATPVCPMIPTCCARTAPRGLGRRRLRMPRSGWNSRTRSTRSSRKPFPASGTCSSLGLSTFRMIPG